jgi:hypothetical protein
MTHQPFFFAFKPSGASQKIWPHGQWICQKTPPPDRPTSIDLDRPCSTDLTDENVPHPTKTQSIHSWLAFTPRLDTLTAAAASSSPLPPPLAISFYPRNPPPPHRVLLRAQDHRHFSWFFSTKRRRPRRGARWSIHAGRSPTRDARAPCCGLLSHNGLARRWSQAGQWKGGTCRPHGRWGPATPVM